jgi:hypothetical protein
MNKGMTGEDKSDCNRLLLAIQPLLHALLAQTGALSRRRRKPGRHPGRNAGAIRVGRQPILLDCHGLLGCLRRSAALSAIALQSTTAIQPADVIAAR